MIKEEGKRKIDMYDFWSYTESHQSGHVLGLNGEIKVNLYRLRELILTWLKEDACPDTKILSIILFGSSVRKPKQTPIKKKKGIFFFRQLVDAIEVEKIQPNDVDVMLVVNKSQENSNTVAPKIVAKIKGKDLAFSEEHFEGDYGSWTQIIENQLHLFAATPADIKLYTSTIGQSIYNNGVSLCDRQYDHELLGLNCNPQRYFVWNCIQSKWCAELKS